MVDILAARDYVDGPFVSDDLGPIPGTLPTGNADIGKTMAKIQGLDIDDIGKLAGRPSTEAMRGGGATPTWTASRQASEPDAAGRRTVANTRTAGDTRYRDAAGHPGRTLGLSDATPTGER